MTEFPLSLKVALFAIEAVIFVVILVKSGNLAKSEEESFMHEKRSALKKGAQ